MSSPTRRESRAAEAATRPPARRRPRIGLWLTLVLIVLLLLAAWVGFRALGVKNDLESARASISQLQEGADPASVLPEIGARGEAAASVSSDPIWRLFEFIPAAGDNLKGVRLAAANLDVLVNDVAMPVLSARDSGESMTGALLRVIDESAPEIAETANDLIAVADSPFLIGPVRSGVDEVATIVAGVGPAAELLPSLLGADGAKNYLLVFPNNAELLALGGSAASQTLIRVDQGQLSIAGQASSASYANGHPPREDVDRSAIDLYGPYLLSHINTTMSRPDFPTAAQTIAAFWKRDIAPDQIDGVISVDPIALSRMLKATGPIPLETGDELSEQNAVSLLLNEVYFRWDSYAEPERVDGFFAAAAAAVFEKLSGGDFNPKDMLWAIGESIDQGDIMLWSEDPAIQEVIDGQRVSGVLPTDNSEETVMGVYFRNGSASKIDYYTRAAIDASSVCEADAATFTATTTLTMDISQDAADALPAYVKSAYTGSEYFRTEVFVYGPPGTTVVAADVNGRDVRALMTDVDDLGRPVAKYEVLLMPTESASVTAVFTGNGDFAPLEVRSTPMVAAPTVNVTNGCG